jgi:glycogen(starch) synthase
LRLLVAGAGNHDRELQAQARRLRIGDAVDWLGFLSGRQLRAVFADADVVVMPSLYEPFGIAALEAAASGTPLVVADTGGLRDLVRAGVATGSFPAADVAGLVTAVAEVLADPAAAKRSAARAARIVRRDYTWPVVAERTAAVYTGALAGRSVR